MTTKKQRREQVAAKNAARKEAERLQNLELLRIDREKRERREYDMQRAERKKATALTMRKKYERDITVGEFLSLAHSFEEK